MQVAQAQNKHHVKYFIEKVIPNPFTGNVLNLSSGGKEIFLVRDFRDMLCSMIAFNKKNGGGLFSLKEYQNEEEYISSYIKIISGQLSQAWRQRGDSCILIKYEDLVTSPEIACQKIFRYIGVDCSDTAISNAVETFRTANSKGQKNHATTSTPDSSIGRYRDELSIKTINHCNSELGSDLELFGYLI